MFLKNIIRKALRLNNVYEDDIVEVQVNTISFNLHIFEMVVLLLYNFSLQHKMFEEEMNDFFMKNFEAIFDIVITEIKIALLHFYNIYNDEFEGIVELHNKDECFIVLAVQDKVNNKLRKLM